MRKIVFILSCLMLGACNSIYYKPHTLDKNATIYAPRGGYSMQRSVKQIMNERGYDIHVGTLKTEKQSDELDFQTFEIPNNAKYTSLLALTLMVAVMGSGRVPPISG